MKHSHLPNLVLENPRRHHAPCGCLTSSSKCLETKVIMAGRLIPLFLTESIMFCGDGVLFHHGGQIFMVSTRSPCPHHQHTSSPCGSDRRYVLSSSSYAYQVHQLEAVPLYMTVFPRSPILLGRISGRSPGFGNKESASSSRSEQIRMTAPNRGPLIQLDRSDSPAAAAVRVGSKIRVRRNRG